MSAPVAARLAQSRGQRLLAGADRFLPLVWIGFYLLLPVTSRSGDAFQFWNDQIRDLDALSAVLDGRSSITIDLDRIGPAYIALAAAIHWVSGLSPEAALVWLSRGSYALSIAAAMVMVRSLVRRLTSAGPSVSLGAQLVLGAFAFSAWTWHWSDFPWSHFLAACLGTAFYALRFVPAAPSLLISALTGGVLGLLALTRTFEVVGVLLAWGIVTAAFGLARLRSPRMWPSGSVLAGVAGFAVVTIGVHVVTGKSDPFIQYGSDLDSQAGTLAAEEIASTPPLRLDLIPVKAVQLFLDPCFDANCAVEDYQGGPRSVYELWRMPLAIQLPALALLPLVLVALAAIGVWAIRRRQDALQHAPQLRALLEMSVAATGITFGYLASTLAGSSHLKYGFARDFMLPATLAAVVLSILAVTGTWVALGRRHAGLTRFGREPSVLAVAVLLCAGVLSVTSVVRSTGLPRFEGRHLASIEYRAECGRRACDVSIRATAPSGRARALPAASTLTFGCGRSVPDTTLYVPDLDDPVAVAACRNPRLVAAWPIVMGLPPTPDELYAVRVVNRSS